jgi:energy-coupling factor transporter ATP-binding protein EcfA2
MTERQKNLFPRGAEWVRADFHLHTLKEPGKSRAKFRAEFRDRENEFAKEWVARLVAEDVRIAVVTNHNFFDVNEFKALRRQARKEDILVLPGLELGVNAGKGGVHTLVVFSPDWVDDQAANDGIDRFLCSQFNSNPDEGCRSHDDLAGCLAKLDGYRKDYFIVFAHVDSDNGLFHELDAGQLKHVIEKCGDRWERVLGLQKVKTPDYVQQTWPGQTLPAFVEGSDPRDSIEEVGKSDRSCWLKVGDLSFESVKFALTHHPQRVRNTPPETRSGPVIHSVRFEGGRLGGGEYGLSDQLTTLIGSRGSGKSAVLECLRYALDFEPGQNADAKYKNDLVKAMLANGGVVIVTGQNEHDQVVEVRRPLGLDPQVTLEGKPTRLRPRDVFPNVLYFGQKDLGNRHEGFEAEFFAMLTGATTPDDRHQEAQLVLAVRQAVTEYQSVLKAKGLDEEYAQEAEKLRHQLEVYAKKGVDQQLAALTAFDADRRLVAELREQFSKFCDGFGQIDTDWREVLRDWPVLKSESLKEPAERLAKLSEMVQSLKTDYDRLVAGLLGATVELDAIHSRLQDAGRERQEEFSQLLRELDAPGLDLDAYRKMKSRYGQLVKLLQAASNRVQAEQSALSQVLTAAQNLYGFRVEMHRRESAALTECAQSIPEAIQLSSRFEGDQEAFGQFLSTHLRGTGFRAISRDKLTTELSNGLAVFQHRDKLHETLGATADVEKLRTALFQNLAEFLTFRVPDHRQITFNGTPIDRLSLGQRATAILTLLTSLDRYPVMLLDQPEDDLDNETIFRHVVEPLLERKKQCQFVIATHNANIPVLGDAEQIHACREVEHGKYDHESGSLDCPATSQTIVNIMEGGAEAFLRRLKVLQQWTKSVSDRKS